MNYPYSAGCGCDEGVGSGVSTSAGCSGLYVPCITVVGGVVTALTDRLLTIPAGDVCPSDLCQEGATDGQVLTWNGTEYAPATPSAPTNPGVTYQPISCNYAVGITFGGTNATFFPYDIDGSGTKYAIFVLDVEPTTCRFSFVQQEVNAANDCEVGFQIAAVSDFSTVLFEDYVALGEPIGLKTDLFTLTGVTGGPPYYVRWGYKNPATLPTLNAIGMSLVFA